jgi:hypothetical protein
MIVYTHTECELRRSARKNQLGKWDKKLVGAMRTTYAQSAFSSCIFDMSVTEGITQLGDIAAQSIRDEMAQMCVKKVWEGVQVNSLTPHQNKNIISSKKFLKAKHTADGAFDKLKSRLVAGGHLQDRDIYDNGSSPTVSTTRVFIVAALAAKEHRALANVI